MKKLLIVPLLAFSVLSTGRAAVVVEQITTANNSPAAALTAIEIAFPNFPEGTIHLGA